MCLRSMLAKKRQRLLRDKGREGGNQGHGTHNCPQRGQQAFKVQGLAFKYRSARWVPGVCLWCVRAYVRARVRTCGSLCAAAAGLTACSQAVASHACVGQQVWTGDISCVHEDWWVCGSANGRGVRYTESRACNWCPLTILLLRSARCGGVGCRGQRRRCG